MVQNQRCQLLRKYQVVRKGDEELILEFGASGYYMKRSRPKLLSLLLLSLLSCTFILAPHLFPSCSLLDSFGGINEHHVAAADVHVPLCSSISNGTICCDRSSIRSDICFMKGDLRTQSSSFSVFLYSSEKGNDSMNHGRRSITKEELQHEKIKPYTRKWEASVMSTIDQLHLISTPQKSNSRPHCDVQHDVPAVFFSTGGYTGNVYHEFNDGILPLFITSQHLKKKVVFVILEYHDWWITKYENILSHLSDYPPIDFNGDKRTHCFPEATVGMRIHNELTLDSSLMEGNVSIADFRSLLDRAYLPRISGLIEEEKQETKLKLKNKEQQKPKLAILSRNGSRAILNEESLVNVAEKMGFEVEIIRPTPRSELAKMYRVLNSSDVMIGVHGAAMTHFLFMKPGSVFIQVVPLGTVWAAETYLWRTCSEAWSEVHWVQNRSKRELTVQ